MANPDTSHADLIRSIGGKAKLAGALGIDRDVLTKWHIRGIPAKYWHRVIDLARAASIEVTAEDLNRSKP